MLHVSLFQEFDIRVYELDTWEFAPHKHTFFEMVYIVAGKGIHRINDHALGYEAGSLFLLTPADKHDFEIYTHSRFCIITFAEIYFSKERIASKVAHKGQSSEGGLHKESIQDLVDFSEMFTQLERIFYNHSTSQSAIELANPERIFCDHIIQQLLWEVEQKNLFYAHIVRHLMIALLSVVGRALQEQSLLGEHDAASYSQVLSIVNHIQRNIGSRHLLSLEALASTFHKSKDSLNDYFKLHTGKTLKEYITEYRISIVKMRLLYTNMTIAEIAFELGFTDESHLNKTFKSQHHHTASEYRRSMRKSHQ